VSDRSCWRPEDGNRRRAAHDRTRPRGAAPKLEAATAKTSTPERRRLPQPRKLSHLAGPILTSRHFCSRGPAGRSGSRQLSSPAATMQKRGAGSSGPSSRSDSRDGERAQDCPRNRSAPRLGTAGLGGARHGALLAAPSRIRRVVGGMTVRQRRQVYVGPREPRILGRVVGHERRAGDFRYGPTRSLDSSRVQHSLIDNEPEAESGRRAARFHA
jgi:hypothetical protein